MKHILSISIVFTFIYCSTWDTRLILVNNTDKKIRFIYELKTQIDSIPDLKDCQITNPYEINPNNEQVVLSQNKWDVYFKFHPKEILRIYIISEDSLSKYGTCKVFQNQIFLKRFDLTYDDLVKFKWRIEFNGK